jgi:superoxide reductase
MTPEHLINFIMIETNLGKQYKGLTAEDKPHAEFALQDGEKLIAAYEYCNLHGLWKAEV